ncbi:hypothetical protein CEF21_15420 [Bacillus sp. FJAT-42376]|nr:hypothetical protein CEF21_15420 [Bacillus sp. FJAT-42376]
MEKSWMLTYGNDPMMMKRDITKDKRYNPIWDIEGIAFDYIPHIVWKGSYSLIRFCKSNLLNETSVFFFHDKHHLTVFLYSHSLP